MSELTLHQIREAILQGLQRVGERFARDPTPTDGSIQSGLREKRRRAQVELRQNKKAADRRR